ncbi:MAG: O-antigen ligase family protein [Actinomycetes bacterium]|nr:O-antigen ligase family protein [Actinomycetes bacterium]
MDKQRKETILWLVSCVLVSVATLFAGRYLYFLHGLPRLYFATPLLVCSAVLLYAFLFRRRGFTLRDELRSSWPLLLLALMDAGYLIIAYCLARVLHWENLPSPRWWLNILFAVLASYAAFLLGRVNIGRRRALIANFLAVFLAISLLFGAFQYLQYAGYSNPVAGAIHVLNVGTAKLYGMWEWNASEVGIRVAGINTDPVAFMFPAMVGVAWVFGVSDVRWRRILIGILSLGIIFLSGSRGALIVTGVMSIVYLVRRVAQSRKKESVGQSDRRKWVWFGLGLLLVILVAVIVFWVFGSNGLVLRLRSIADDVSRNGVTLTTIDTALSGRLTVWRLAFQSIAQHPFGTWHPLGNLSGTTLFGSDITYWHAHNDLLQRWVIGGPLLSAVLVLMFVWMYIRWKQDRLHPVATDFGLYFFLVVVLSGLTESVFFDKAFLVLGFFVLGILTQSPCAAGAVDEDRRDVLPPMKEDVTDVYGTT